MRIKKPKAATSKTAKPVQNEHIFASSQLTPLAIKWKELNAAKRHKEAMEVLEQIIKGSTAMFERLAQYEDYHYTVDLPILVSAAQEKVVKWLLRWQPRKGRLFSWFSVHERTPILLADGTYKLIGDLVKERYSGKVICWDVEAKEFKTGQVTDWSRVKCTRKEWRKLTIRNSRGYPHPVYITHGHLIWTQTGWTPVDWLNPRDTLYIDQPCLTADGQATLLGLYLGDGSILKKDFRVTHGKDQRFYNDWLRQKFRGAMYVAEEGRAYWNKFTKKMMDYSGQSSLTIPLVADLWSDFNQLAHPKQVTPWIMDRLTPLSLAVWYMDDGHLSLSGRNCKVSLATNGFTEQECWTITASLKTRFGLYFKPNVQKSGHILCLKARSRETFFQLIAPFVLPEFDYKLPSAYRKTRKIDSILIADRLVAVRHKTVSAAGEPSWEIRSVFKIRNQGKKFRDTESFKWKYDLTVEGHPNFFAGNCKLLIHNSKCAKNSFRSEVVKVVQYRKRFHVTSDNLERFYGEDDHEVNKADLSREVRTKIESLTCRWGDEQEIGAIRFLIDCIVMDEHDKQASIKGAACAWGLSLDLSRFFYNWSLVALRTQLYEKIHVPFTEQDLLRAKESYTFLPDFIDTIGIDNTKKLLAVMGGTRLRLPTLASLVKLKEDYELHSELVASDQDPDTFAAIARKRKRTPRTAEQVFNDMTDTLDPRRFGEREIYGGDAT